MSFERASGEGVDGQAVDFGGSTSATGVASGEGGMSTNTAIDSGAIATLVGEAGGGGARAPVLESGVSMSEMGTPSTGSTSPMESGGPGEGGAATSTTLDDASTDSGSGGSSGSDGSGGGPVPPPTCSCMGGQSIPTGIDCAAIGTGANPGQAKKACKGTAGFIEPGLACGQVGTYVTCDVGSGLGGAARLCQVVSQVSMVQGCQQQGGNSQQQGGN